MDVLSLCSGIGGLDLGIRLAVPGAISVGYVERDAYCQCVLRARIADGDLNDAPIINDVRDIGSDWIGRADCIAAGFPCQPHSCAGKRRGIDDERWTWPDIAAAVRVVRPSLVFLENVPGLFATNGFAAVLADLAALGFDAEWTCVRACDVGAPHRRERVFVLAYHPGRGLGELRVARNEAGLADGGNAGVADAGGDRRQQDHKCTPCDEGADARRAETDCNLAASAGAGVADAAERGREPSAGAAGPQPGAGGHGGAGADGGDMADAPGEREREPWYAPAPVSELRRRPGAGRGGGGMDWPPEPDDDAGWAAVLAERPDLAPALAVLRGMADGPPDRMDCAMCERRHRLRALGNAVVPAQAALAWRILAERIGGMT